MILFCEECGRRNSISLTPALIESNSFTCQFCRFRSPFPFLDKERNSTSADAFVSWHPEVLHLSPETAEQETAFDLSFSLASGTPELTLEPFRDLAPLIAVEKNSPADFTVTLKPAGREGGIPDGPALIFCEENTMTWGTIQVSHEQDASGKKEKRRQQTKEPDAPAAAKAPPRRPLKEAGATPEKAPYEPPGPACGNLRQELQECRAQLHQVRTTSFRMQKELSIRRQVMDSQNCGILFVSPEQQILYANPVFLNQYGGTLKAVQAKRLEQVIRLTSPDETLEAALQAAAEQGGWQGGVVLRDTVEEQKSGTLPSTLSISWSGGGEDGHEKGFVCLLFPKEAAPVPQAETVKASTQNAGLNADALTGLVDRPSFQQYLEDSLQLAGDAGDGIGLLYVDLDHFRRINRIFGPGFGDKVLCSVATILQKCAREAGADLVARVSGDEFAIVLPPPSDRTRAKKLAERIMQRFRTPLENESRAILIRPSIGLSVYPEDGGTPLELLRNADTAMEAAKNEGGNRICQWNSGMKIQAAESLYLENDLRKAVAEDQLINFYQPQISLANGSICGMEALARWIHPSKGMIAPAAFIPIAESTGLIEKLGIDLVRKACIQGKKWRDMGFKRFVMAVNLSGRLLRRRDLFHQIMSCIEVSGYPPDGLEVEFTEGVLIENMEFTIDLINRLRAEGVRMAIDDFGTGYSSLTYLQHLRVDKIKIDRSFITNVTTSKTDAAITLGVISIAKNLGFKVIAEGVETEDHLFFLQKSKCDEGQGYLFSAPISEKEMTNLLMRDSSVALSHKRMIDRFYSIQARDK
jgi:diguanylate cyclase (GGDEF)-like protein